MINCTLLNISESPAVQIIKETHALDWLPIQRRRSSVNYEKLLLRRRFNEHIRKEMRIREREVLFGFRSGENHQRELPTVILNLNRNIDIENTEMPASFAPAAVIKEEGAKKICIWWNWTNVGLSLSYFIYLRDYCTVVRVMKIVIPLSILGSW